jgi:hypothetical protein
MTMLQRRPTQRFTRAHYERLLERLYEQVDRAEAAQRADRDRIAALIERQPTPRPRRRTPRPAHRHVRGAAVEKLTANGHRAVEFALRDVARDVAGERLEAVETRMASGPLGLGDRGRQWDAAPADGARPVTPWVYSPGAADQLWAVNNTVTTWARHIADGRKARLILGSPRLFVVDRRGGAEVQRRAQSELAAVWLIQNIESVRHDEAAAQIHEEIVGMAQENDRAILGDPGLAEFYGVCDQPDVRLEPVIWLGPRCTGLGPCDHESCRRARNEDLVLRPQMATCGVQLYGAPDATKVKCQACGAVYSASARKRTMRDALPDSLGTIPEVAGALGKLDAPVHVDAIDSAIRRGHIPERGRNGQGHRLVRVGDVEAWLARRSERRAKSGKIAS